jgi:hypothetical protein
MRRHLIAETGRSVRPSGLRSAQRPRADTFDLTNIGEVPSAGRDVEP